MTTPPDVASVIWIWMLAALILASGLGGLFRKAVDSDLGPVPRDGATLKIHFGPWTHAYVGRAGSRVWLHLSDRNQHIEILLTPEQVHELASALNDHAVDSVAWTEQQKDS